MATVLMKRVGDYRQRIREWYTDLVSTEFGRKSFQLGIFGVIAAPLFIQSFHRLPSGHVAVIQNIFGNYKPYLYDEDSPYWIIPFYEKSYSLRTWPVRKRLVQELTTKDNKIVEVLIHLRLKIKICWAQDIVSRMGVDFGRTFLEQEASLDAETVVAQYTYEELVADDAGTQSIVDDLISRTREAACFCRLELLDMTVLFRDPLDA